MTTWGRRGLFTALAIVLIACGVSATWATTRSNHGNPDPGGHILAALTIVDRAVPARARVMLRQESEPRWDSCDGRAGTFGWDDVTMDVEFRTTKAPRTLIAETDASLRAAGWQRTRTQNTPLGPSERWSRTMTGSTAATAQLSPGTSGGGTGIYWDLTAMAPPHGQRSSGC